MSYETKIVVGWICLMLLITWVHLYKVDEVNKVQSIMIEDLIINQGAIVTER